MRLRVAKRVLFSRWSRDPFAHRYGPRPRYITVKRAIRRWTRWRRRFPDKGTP